MKVSSNNTLGNMCEEHMVDSYESTEITHNDCKESKLHYTNKEFVLPEGKKTTYVSDLEGNIITPNTTFVKISGYSKDELIGMPHHILRHPDMPKATFESMWNALKSTGKWKGYVKNLRKDGGYYWVQASVFSISRNNETVGYTSILTQASSEAIESYSKLYNQMNEKDRLLTAPTVSLSLS